MSAAVGGPPTKPTLVFGLTPVFNPKRPINQRVPKNCMRAPSRLPPQKKSGSLEVPFDSFPFFCSRKIFELVTLCLPHLTLLGFFFSTRDESEEASLVCGAFGIPHSPHLSISHLWRYQQRVSLIDHHSVGAKETRRVST